MRRLAILAAALSSCATPVAKVATEKRDLPRDAGSPSQAAALPGPQATPDGGDKPAHGRPVTIVAGGDVTLGYHYEEHFDEQVSKGRTREEMFAYGFQEVRPVAREADLFVVNLECPFTARGEKMPKNFNFRARPELVSALVAGGVGAVSLANNHLMDYGPLGLIDTLATLEEARIPHFGAGRNLQEARRPARLERHGIRIAFLGYLFLGEHSIEPPEVIATDTSPGVAGHHSDVALLERMLREDIELAKTDADLVIPFFHWGREGHHLPEPYQIRLAHAAIEAGASAVFGSHPHVLQGMELYRGAPVVYSLGNFVFGGNWDPRKKESALIRARFSSAGYLFSEIIPLQTDRYPQLPMQPFVLTDERAQSVLRHLAEYSMGFEHPLPELARWKP
jgi:poly-gamma-glutamate synthesis protein (capsule biosynthesis protein)